MYRPTYTATTTAPLPCTATALLLAVLWQVHPSARSPEPCTCPLAQAPLLVGVPRVDRLPVKTAVESEDVTLGAGEHRVLE